MFKKILLPIDLQETLLEDKALNIAIDEARKHQVPMVVLSVIPSFNSAWVASFFPDDAIEKAEREAASDLKRYVKERFPDDLDIVPRVAVGSPTEVILEEAAKEGADLIIMPSHTKGLEQVFLGSCASRVVERAHCTVMVIKDCKVKQ